MINNDLTNSAVDPQNILNNPVVLHNIQEFLGISGMIYKDKIRLQQHKISNFR
jgi:hypothetical protein